MLTRSYSMLLVLAFLSAPTVRANPSFGDAIAKAAIISGRWIGKLDRGQSSIFAPDPVSDLALNVHTRVQRNGGAIETSFQDVRLELGIRYGLESHLYERIHLGHPVSTGEDGVALSGFRNGGMPAQEELTVTITPGPNGKTLKAVIAYGGQLASVVFERPAADPNVLAQGDWMNRGDWTGVSVFHIYPAKPGGLVATFDRVSFDSADLGYPFGDGSDIKSGRLGLVMESPIPAHSVDLTLYGSYVLYVGWRGSGFLSEPEYRRLEEGEYPGVLRPD